TIPKLIGGWKGLTIALGPGDHIGLIPSDAICGIGKAGLEAGCVVLGLSKPGGIWQPCPLGFDHGELLVAVDQHVIRCQPVAALAAGHDAPGADHLSADAGASGTPARSV